MVAVKPKDTTKMGRWKDLLLAASKGSTRDPSQNSVSPVAKLGKL